MHNGMHKAFSIFLAPQPATFHPSAPPCKQIVFNNTRFFLIDNLCFYWLVYLNLIVSFASPNTISFGSGNGTPLIGMRTKLVLPRKDSRIAY